MAWEEGGQKVLDTYFFLGTSTPGSRKRRRPLTQRASAERVAVRGRVDVNDLGHIPLTNERANWKGNLVYSYGVRTCAEILMAATRVQRMRESTRFGRRAKMICRRPQQVAAAAEELCCGFGCLHVVDRKQMRAVCPMSCSTQWDDTVCLCDRSCAGFGH